MFVYPGLKISMFYLHNYRIFSKYAHSVIVNYKNRLICKLLIYNVSCKFKAKIALNIAKGLFK